MVAYIMCDEFVSAKMCYGDCNKELYCVTSVVLIVLSIVASVLHWLPQLFSYCA